MKPMQPPFPKNYDPNAKCDYHGGGVGHSTEKCVALKHKVEALINSGWVKFHEDKPNVEANPLSGHGNPSTNAIEGREHKLVKNVSEIRSSKRFIFETLLKLGLLKGEYNLGEKCEFHPDAKHFADKCTKFEIVLQDLLDKNFVQVYREGMEEELFAQDGGKLDVTLPEPLVIHFTRSPSTPTIQERQPITIQAPSSFPYKSEKAVPWKYGARVSGGEQRTEGQPTNGEPVVENISGIGGMTRSGRIFTPPILMKNGAGSSESMMTKNAKESLKGKMIQTDEGLRKDDKKEISNEEAGEFLKFIQQSEYKVVEQLNRMPARISLLDLLMHSTSHRELLMKILSGAHVEKNISLDSFEGIVSNITANNYLTFTDEEIPVEGRGHNKALHVSVKCLDHVIARVLIDNGSSLNVMPKETLGKLPCEGIHMKPSAMIVRAFDGSKREVMGEVELSIQIGPCVFQVTFQVMDILPAYSCLLGRPWIHSAGVVPSTLHQKLKYVMGDKLVIVSGEEDILVSGPSSSRYIEAAEEALETAFQSLEIVGNAYVEPYPMNPRLSCASLMTAKVMLKEGYEYGKRLGKDKQGLIFPLEITKKRNRHGLGYKPTREDKRRLVEERRERGLARMQGKELGLGKICICDIKESFRSAGWINTSPIAAVNDEEELGGSNFVWPCVSDAPLNNWETLDLPVMFNLVKM
ncbi:uncharacterized protein LOC114165323 [Vigna unguiculata]|uniref:uncharacterized protein LOC114165323 n=1 Tax=Vigna unguiculata TaxID=3917 RepID=UPI00101657CE|nr:uncharacterized protein LOC114165323 [Vigna unguiculata]